MTTYDLRDRLYAAVSVVPQGVAVADVVLGRGDRCDCGPAGVLDASDLETMLGHYTHYSGGGYRPQLRSLAFLVSGAIRVLDGFFPLLRALDEAGRTAFYTLAGEIVAQLDLRLLGEGGRDCTAVIPHDTAYLVAGQIAEVFFYRQDVLQLLLVEPRRIWLYTTPRAYTDGGGVSGGCYSPPDECIKLVVARLYEGFYGFAPGVCPFLHEFGHMLDSFDAGRGRMGRGMGFLPGMRSSDGPIYTPAARVGFLRGKALERERYLLRFHGDASGPPPLGHPYVFQNDAEFLAGYFEMFFRNPHAFAASNPELYAGFVALFAQDTRRAWETDFLGYVEANQRFYQSGQRPGPTRLTVAEI